MPWHEHLGFCIITWPAYICTLYIQCMYVSYPSHGELAMPRHFFVIGFHTIKQESLHSTFCIYGCQRRKAIRNKTTLEFIWVSDSSLNSVYCYCSSSFQSRIPQKIMATISTLKKSVSFPEGDVVSQVFSVENYDECDIDTLFYSQDDFKRFKLERRLAKDRSQQRATCQTSPIQRRSIYYCFYPTRQETPESKITRMNKLMNMYHQQ